MKDEAVGVLVSFMKDMNKWETSYHNAFMKDHSIDKSPYRDELNDIFEKWCTSKERKTGRQISLKVSFPPDYDPENDEIMDVSVVKNKASVIVQKHTGFKNKYRYTLHFKNDEWRIDKKEWLDDDENGKEKWVQAYL
jgi:hypothetical protein